MLIGEFLSILDI